MNHEVQAAKGILITFEGIEGCGKTTQMTRLRSTLVSRGLSATTTFEPGEGPIGSRIRDDLLSHRAEPLDPVAELMLYLADRAQHVRRFIEPALQDGKVVLCDRYVDSTLAYQGYGRGISLDLIKQLNAFVTRGLTPDLTFLLDCPPETGLNRIRGGGLDRMESQELAFHQRVWNGYLTIGQQEPERIAVIDAAQPAQAVFEQILDVLSTRGFLK